MPVTEDGWHGRGIVTAEDEDDEKESKDFEIRWALQPVVSPPPSWRTG